MLSAEDRLLKGLDGQRLGALLALVDAFLLSERAIEAIGAELALRQAVDMEADRAAAVDSADAAAVAVHEAFEELALDYHLQLGVVCGGIAAHRLVVDDASIAGHTVPDVIEVQVSLSASLDAFTDALELVMLLDLFTDLSVGDLLRQKRDVHVVVRVFGRLEHAIQLIAAAAVQVRDLVALDALLEVVHAVALRDPVRATDRILSAKWSKDRVAELSARPSHIEQLGVVEIAAIVAGDVRCGSKCEQEPVNFLLRDSAIIRARRTHLIINQRSRGVLGFWDFGQV